MTRSMLRFVVALALTVFLTSLAHAEVLELEGMVKAVDSDDRTITIERKTAKGTKTLELEVAKKAGDLTGLKVGDTISFGYDPDLEIVTKIGGGDDGESAAEKKRCLVTFSISETGDCVLRVQRAAAAFVDTSRAKQKDGTWVCKRVFAKPSDMELFQGAYGPVLNVRVDKKQQCLVFKADTVPEADKKFSQVTYPQKFRVPFEVTLDLSVTGNKFLFQIQPLPTLLGQRQALVNIKSGDAFANKVTVDVASMTRDAQGKPAPEPPLLKEETISLDEPWEKRFRLPVPNVRSRDAYVLRMGTLGESAVEVRSLMVRGVPLPSVGIKLGETNGVVFAESVVPQSLADEAGVEVGDAISAIQGKPVSSVNEAVERLSDLPFGETSEITLQRGDDKKTIRVKPTFDQ
jgi:hypothetical protein